ncbi:MAG: DUF2806 domain-containing protein [Sphingobium sp.]|nr:DUF2806 domain-containing protein [Sphingobium sp.]
MSEENDSNLPVTSNSVQAGGVIEKIDAIAPKGWRMKLAKVAAQLIVGSEKGAVAYGEVRDRLDTIEGRTTVSKALAEAVAQQSVNDPELMERAKARFLGTAFQKQQNLEAVIEGASEQLIALPPPDLDSSVANFASESENAAKVDEGSPEPLNPDWAATFSNFAENATTNDLRDRLSRILAGELMSPGTYSRATVRQIVELEKADLDAMRRVIPYVLGDEILSCSHIEEPAVTYLIPLLDAGLVLDSTYSLNRSWPRASLDKEMVWLPGRKKVVGFSMKVGQQLSFKMIKLTRAGEAVVDLLGREDEDTVLRNLARKVSKDIYHNVSVGDVSGNNVINIVKILPILSPLNVSNSGLSSNNYFNFDFRSQKK